LSLQLSNLSTRGHQLIAQRNERAAWGDDRAERLVEFGVARFAQNFERQIPIRELADEDRRFQGLLAVELGIGCGRGKLATDILRLPPKELAIVLIMQLMAAGARRDKDSAVRAANEPLRVMSQSI